MKTFAIAALLGLISAKDTTTVWSLKSVLADRDQQVLDNYYGDFSTNRANNRPPMRSHVQMANDSDSDSSSDEEEQNVQYGPADSGRADGYVRALPERFSADSDDLFMRSMISTYATEGENKDGSGDGKFSLTQKQAKAAATEVIGTHKGLSGPAAEAYLGTYWQKAWGHFDVNQSGAINVARSPELMRFLCSDQYMSLG
jgi:hypothetical protein